MKKLHFLILATLLLLLPAVGRAAEIISATVAVTNAAGTTNGQTITVNANVRTWTNSVVIPASQIATNSSIGGAATNLFNQIATSPYAGLSLTRSGTNGIVLQTAPGGTLAVTLSDGWGTVVLATNVLTSATAVRVPYTVEGAAQQTNIVSGIVAMVGANQSTNAIPATAPAVANLVGLSNTQAVSGEKTFTGATVISNAESIFYIGTISNAAGISGMAGAITNGVFHTNTFADPKTTNLVNYGNAISSPGSGSGSEAFGSEALSQGTASSAFGYQSLAKGNASTALGVLAIADGDNSIALGVSALATNSNAMALGANSIATNTSSIAIGVSAFTTVDNQLKLGTASQYTHVSGNLRVDGNTELHWSRFPATSLANGNNAGVIIGTNTFIEVSGPTAAFNINGIAGGADGKFLIILNQTTYNMTIAHDSGTDPAAANRIYTMTGADRATTGNGAAILIYSGNASRWILISLDP